ncbi:MAG: hypothetical protein ACREO0_03320, partial [Pseudoxanthomonas sp.]
IAGSGYNGTAWVTRGAAMRLFFGYDQEEAMAKCQNTTTECRVYAKVISDGSDASGVVWVDG